MQFMALALRGRPPLAPAYRNVDNVVSLDRPAVDGILWALLREEHYALHCHEQPCRPIDHCG